MVTADFGRVVRRGAEPLVEQNRLPTTQIVQGKFDQNMRRTPSNDLVLMNFASQGVTILVTPAPSPHAESTHSQTITLRFAMLANVALRFRS